MQKITPFLWFDGQLEEAMNFYTGIFKNAKVVHTNKLEGKMLTAVFQLEGQEFMGLNGGPMFKFTEAVSFFINCQTQEEVDDLWDKLSAGGSIQQCGWLKDKFGLSWQIIPAALMELLHSKDSVKSNRVMQAMLKMKKIDIKTLQEAHDQQ